MSTPICSRCQKIYTAGSAPAKCVNCGGDVRVPGAASKPVPPSAPKTPVRPTQGAIANSTPIEDLDFTVATYKALTVSRIRTVGELIRTTEDDLFNRYGLDSKTISEIKAVLYKANLSLTDNPTRPTNSHNSSSTGISRSASIQGQSATTSSSDGGCLGTLFAIIFGIIALAVIGFVGGYIVLLIVEFFSGLDTGDTTRPIRVPFRWRR